MKKLPQLNSRYQIFFFTCPAHKPFHFGYHPWVVTVVDGNINRFEIIHKIYRGKDNFGYVYKNYYTNPAQGIQKHLWSNEYWDSRLIGQVIGDENGLAERMINFIHTYSPDYLYKDTYHLYPGPNIVIPISHGYFQNFPKRIYTFLEMPLVKNI